MAVESIGSVLSNPQAQVQQASLGQDDLFEILLTQLTYQDPLKPLDNQEFIAQLAQFTSLEQSRQVNGKIDNLLTQQSATQAIELLGKTVRVQGETGFSDGDVQSIRFVQGSPELTVRVTEGDNVRLLQAGLSQISLVR